MWTGGYVYASPAVAQVPGGRPTVYLGSYSGRFYALDARSGHVRWSRRGRGKISGGATVVGDIVYFANLGKKPTIGLGARTGRKVFEFGRGSYNPVVSDGKMIYLTGYLAMYALRPQTTDDKKARASPRADARRAHRARTAGTAASAPARRIGASRARSSARPSAASKRRPEAAPRGGPRSSACGARKECTGQAGQASATPTATASSARGFRRH